MQKEYRRLFIRSKQKLARKHKALGTLFARHKNLVLEPEFDRDPFTSLVRAIAHQQLHANAANTILTRMLKRCAEHEGTDTSVINLESDWFPKPQTLLALPEADLRACGFSQSKTRSIRDIAEKRISGVVPGKDDISKLSNEEIIERLTTIFGVGRWTVEMLLIFQLGRLDVWPVDDFGVRKGFQVWKKKREMPTARQIKPEGESWAPFQTIVALHLWREADRAKEKRAKKSPKITKTSSRK